MKQLLIVNSTKALNAKKSSTGAEVTPYDLSNLAEGAISFFELGSNAVLAAAATKNFGIALGRKDNVMPFVFSEVNIDTLDIPAALESIIELFRKCNKYIDETTPWILAKENKERLETVIYVLLSAIKHGAVAIKPFLPTTSSKILEQLNITDEDITSFETLKAGTKLNKPEPLFMRINKDV